MSDLQIAVISDVHGNRWALTAVLADIAQRGIRNIVNLGDCLYSPLDPAGTADILMRLDILTVRGNEDRMIVEPQAYKESATLRFVREALQPNHMRWLESLPLIRVVHDELLLCHGTPKRDDEYLRWQLRNEAVVPRTVEELVGMLAVADEPVVLCGHDHVPGAVRLPDGRLIVSPGSVGLQAFADDRPCPHVMKAGTPHARYAVVARREDGWRAEHVKVSYDWHWAAEAALNHGRSDWAQWLTTGQVGCQDSQA
ncbi:MAG: metallophosphoesterase family protein [Phycisphaerales bacterium]|nr:MAG: metallophosphoesterase family protein [Phycisphaerales bacterium]